MWLKHRPINKKYNTYYKKNSDIKLVIEKRYNILIGVIALLITILLVGLFNMQVVKSDKYNKDLKKATKNLVKGSTAPRGRIYDRNGNLLVDNKPIKMIIYKKPSKITTKKEIKIAYKMADLIDVDASKLTDFHFKEFWVKDNPKKALKKISKKEWRKLDERKITATEIEDLKIERVTDLDLKQYNNHDKEAAYIYYLMNKGYSYAEKIIKDVDVTDSEYALVTSTSGLKGFSVRLDWERTYPYGDLLKTIYGTVSNFQTGIPADLKDYYVKKGYDLNDRVGTSYLEYQYDDYLKGKKDIYEIKEDGTQVLVKEGKRGNDLVLSIDINLQKEVEKIVDEQILKAKKEANTKYFNKAFVVITNPKTGEILAMVGKQIVTKGSGYEILDYTPGVATGSVTAGSVVKGASQITGYNTGALKIGETRQDACVKLAATPIKCSWKSLGTLNDISALQYSSNTYQFYTAMKVAGYNYRANSAFKMKNDAFKIYRDVFNQFGLGVKTGIDLPVESEGVKGKSTTPGLLLDFSIGQYDTYTPLQLAQYMGTVANDGKRIKLHILNDVYSSKGDKLTKKMYSYKEETLNTVKTESKYMERVKEGFKKVISGGTGSGYIDSKFKPAGKTGTSQSFIDTDNNGKVDKETMTNTFAGYAPYDNPTVTFAVASPDISDASSNFTSSVNKRIVRAVSDKYFSMYK